MIQPPKIWKFQATIFPAFWSHAGAFPVGPLAPLPLPLPGGRVG